MAEDDNAHGLRRSDIVHRNGVEDRGGEESDTMRGRVKISDERGGEGETRGGSEIGEGKRVRTWELWRGSEAWPHGVEDIRVENEIFREAE